MDVERFAPWNTWCHPLPSRPTLTPGGDAGAEADAAAAASGGERGAAARAGGGAAPADGLADEGGQGRLGGT